MKIFGINFNHSPSQKNPITKGIQQIEHKRLEVPSYKDGDYIDFEVKFFQDAINKSLKRRGVILGLESLKQVVILINENNLNPEKVPSFLDTVPIAETLLSKSFVEAGIAVMNRDLIRYEVSEKTMMSAIQGNISAAVSIGLTVGVDIVILGNATSTTVLDKKNINQNGLLEMRTNPGGGSDKIMGPNPQLGDSIASIHSYTNRFNLEYIVEPFYDSLCNITDIRAFSKKLGITSNDIFKERFKSRVAKGGLWARKARQIYWTWRKPF